MNQPRLMSGATAGAFAAIPMAAVWMVLSAVSDRGGGATRPFALIATTFLGYAALDGGPGAIALGVALHLAVGAAWGLVFSSLLPSTTTGPAAAAIGALFSFVIFFSMFTITRLVSPLFYAGVDRGALLTANLVYGLALGLTVPLRHRVARSRPRVRATRSSATASSPATPR